MAEAATITKTSNGSHPTLTLDAAVVGAGVAGLYQLHLLRDQGLTVKAFDAASDVGGTWYWNRYPGARFDSEAYIYQYPVLRGSLQGMELEREVSCAAGD